MNALAAIERELLGLGYRPEAIRRDYDFADVLSPGGEERRVALAAFTQVPESYRSAAFGVIEEEGDETAVAGRRALGAPILFAIGTGDVGIWRVGASGAPRLLERVGLEALPDLFRRNADRWRPQAIHRAKSLGGERAAYQLGFVDLDLVPAIEREVEIRLDRLLEKVVGQLSEGVGEDGEEEAFRTAFRLLAAKILIDRKHPAAGEWRDAPVRAVLDGIEGYYGLGRLHPTSASHTLDASAVAAWALLSGAISFRNISSDSLAFVYENTLVTADTRKRFGTHSTPRVLAEYVIGRLELDKYDPETLTIYEPFTGAGSFLVSALRRMRDLLPEDMTGEARHAFLVPRVRGAEIDAFACEVAKLSLILADYPNVNGWNVEAEDLFRPAVLSQGVASATMVVCNPPWEDFTADERETYAHMAAKSLSKPMAVLGTILDAHPEAIGFVLPQGFLRQQHYAELRQRTADLYGRVELTSLPDRIFQRAGLEGAVLIASEPRRGSGTQPTRLSSAVIEDSDRAAFLATGRVGAERRRVRVVTGGDLWIGALDELWEHLERHPRLGTVAKVYRGLQWWTQADGVSTSQRAGYKRGVFRPADSLTQFSISRAVYLNVDADAAMYPAPLARAWDRPKVLANVARLSRGPWRLAAAYDETGLVASQAFFGIWANDSRVPLEALEAILNGPLANAFLTERASSQHFTNKMMKDLPLPKGLRLDGIVEASQRYHRARADAEAAVLGRDDMDDTLNRLLVELDAEVLKAYDLPPRVERQLLDFFRSHEADRRVEHRFMGWIPETFTAFVPLHEYLGPLIQRNRGPWALDAFRPAPEEEVAVLRRYVH